MAGVTKVGGIGERMWVEAQGHAFNGKFRQMNATDKQLWNGAPQGALTCDGNLGTYVWVVAEDLLVLVEYEMHDYYVACSFSNGELRDMPEWVLG